MKVVVFIGGRANYGRLYALVKELKEDKNVEVKILGAGMYCKVEKKAFMEEDFYVDGDMFHDTPENRANTIALVTINATAYLKNENPDFAIVHGDRFECLGFAIAANSCNVKLIHMEAGEVTKVDNDTRWAISALAQYHMCPTEAALIRMSRKSYLYNPMNVGSPIVDLINQLSIKQTVKNKVLISYNPVNEVETLAFSECLNSILDDFKGEDINFIWVNPNIDPGNKLVVKKMKALCIKYQGILEFFKDVEMTEYLSIMKSTVVMLGNSSSGIKEGYILGVPYLIFGDRQNLREAYANCARFVDKNAYVDVVKKVINSYLNGEQQVYKYTGEFGVGKTAEVVKGIMFQEIKKQGVNN